MMSSNSNPWNDFSIPTAPGADTSRRGESYSLKSLVGAIKDDLSADIFSSDVLSTILMDISYEDNPVYDKIRNFLNQRMFFRVNNDFPRLQRSDVPTEIITARYTIDILALSGRYVEESIFISEVFQNEQD